MYIETIPNRQSRPTILLRQGWREGKKVRRRTVANLTHWPTAKLEALRRLLRDEPLASPQRVFVVEHTLPHGAVEAIVGTMRQIGLDTLIASTPCRERQLVLAMIAERLIHPSSKLGTTRLWHTTTLAEELGVANPDQVAKLRTRFGLTQVVLVGDRGTLTQTQIDYLKQYPGLGWIAALRFEAIRKLVETQTLALPLLAHQPLAEITSGQFPGERLVACYNPLVAQARHRKRVALLEATEAELAPITREVAHRTKKPLTKAEIGQKVGRVLHNYHMAKHFEIHIEDRKSVV